MIPLSDVLTHLFNRYGRVDAETLTEMEMKVKEKHYDVSEPIVTIFNKIEELARLGTAAHNPYSDMQKVQLGLRIIKNTSDFETSLDKWYNHPANEHTWDNFKTHFDEAREILRQVRGPDMNNSPYHQVNMLAQSIRDDMMETKQTLLQAITTNDAPVIDEGATQHTFTNPNNQANAATTDGTTQAILELLRVLTADVRGMNVRNPRRPNNNKWYCWSHGMCGHKSAVCRNKKDGHKDEATKENRMGGSNRGCVRNN